MSDYEQEQYEDYLARRDQYEYEKLEYDYKKLESELTKQKLINQKLREACEFYGNIENWRNPKHPKKSDFNTLDSEEGRDVDAIRGGFFVCGKRARQALKEVDAIERGRG